MTRFALLASAMLLMAPAAHADCMTDLATTENSAHVRNFDFQKNPRVKALWDKANKASQAHNDRDCRDALSGLNRMVANPQ